MGKRFRVSLAFYDFIVFLIADMMMYIVYWGTEGVNRKDILIQNLLFFSVIFGCRFLGRIYRQIWRYGGVQCYIRLLGADLAALILGLMGDFTSPVKEVAILKTVVFWSMNTLGALAIRLFYRAAYSEAGYASGRGKLARKMIKIFAGERVRIEMMRDAGKKKVAIIGASTFGVELAQYLINNPKSQILAYCFVDNNLDKEGRVIHGLKVYSETEKTFDMLKREHIQEVVFAVPNMDSGRRLELYGLYKKAGFKMDVFDSPASELPGRKNQLREFEVSDLLFRKEKEIITDKTREYYRDKVILITGGGGSIGSELCRQLAKMGPKQIVILDIYENCAYDVQQGLIFAYKGAVDLQVEIASITNKRALKRVFEKYHPDICINAAAHKHVPLMENNCIEAVENNVFGTLNVIQCCEEYGCSRFMMVSTDKAVNPTNVMGATKRMCEMIMQAYSTRGKVKCSATRFGNVLGSAGSVIPLFKRQIAAGGPVTVTDKRIIRYFMTIPEASQLVLTSGAIAQNGDLFVLDMGQPVKIWDLAANMILMSGVNDVEIIETGLRPGEKLYEELLVKKDDLERTENDLIFIEHEEPVDMASLEEKLNTLRAACEEDDDEVVREAMRKVVGTFKRPEEVNGAV